MKKRIYTPKHERTLRHSLYKRRLVRTESVRACNDEQVRILNRFIDAAAVRDDQQAALLEQVLATQG